MDNQHISIHLIKQGEELPFSLLLLADETREAIEKYIYSCEVYTARIPGEKEDVAVWALSPVNQEEIEIKNIAVKLEYQGKGLGGIIIRYLVSDLREKGYKVIWVGTGDASFDQLRFYRRNGFSDTDTIKNFFTENYPEPIFENGQQLRDMILLKQNL